MIGDKLAVRLRFTGHFSGAFNGIQGQPVDFIAFDIQHVGAGRITEDWHLEDNLTFLLQAGIANIRAFPKLGIARRAGGPRCW